MRWIVLACFALLPPARAWGSDLTCPDSPSHISMENGSYSSQPGVSFLLRHFSATLVPLGKTVPMCLAKTTDVAHGTIFVSNESLTRLFAKKLGATDSKIHDLTIEHNFGMVAMHGEITKVIPIKFSMEGPVSTDGNLISVNVTKIVADGVPVKSLLAMVGEHLSSMLKFKGMGGITVEGNTMSFSPEKVAHLKGFITSVETTPQGLTLHYGKKPRLVVTAATKS